MADKCLPDRPPREVQPSNRSPSDLILGNAGAEQVRQIGPPINAGLGTIKPENNEGINRKVRTA